MASSAAVPPIWQQKSTRRKKPCCLDVSGPDPCPTVGVQLYLRYEDAGVFIDIVNNNSFSGESALYQMYSEVKDWVEVLAPVAGEAIKADAGSG